MLFDTIINVDAVSKYKSLERRLSSFGRNVGQYKSRPVSDISHLIKVTENKITHIMGDANFNSYHTNPEYVKEKLTLEAFELIKQIKETREREEIFVEGLTYYDATVKSGRVVGKKCHYLGKTKAQWVAINEDARILKALELMEHGADEDFNRLYFELADGLPFKSAAAFEISHITKSSNRALNEMANYCDTRWEGKWPWQVKASRKLSGLIKENQQMARNSLRTFRNTFTDLRKKLNEGEMEKSEITLQFRGLADDITSMIEKLGKTSGSLITDLRDKVRSEFGEEHLGGLDVLAKDTITHAVDALSDLKAGIEKQVDDMINGTGAASRPEFDDPAPVAPPMDGDMGFDDDMDGDAELPDDDFDMGDEPDAEEDDFDLDAELDISKDERKKK